MLLQQTQTPRIYPCVHTHGRRHQIGSFIHAHIPPYCRQAEAQDTHNQLVAVSRRMPKKTCGVHLTYIGCINKQTQITWVVICEQLSHHILQRALQDIIKRHRWFPCPVCRKLDTAQLRFLLRVVVLSVQMIGQCRVSILCSPGSSFVLTVWWRNALVLTPAVRSTQSFTLRAVQSNQDVDIFPSTFF